jgi:hypothetical protein
MDYIHPDDVFIGDDDEYEPAEPAAMMPEADLVNTDDLLVLDHEPQKGLPRKMVNRTLRIF